MIDDPMSDALDDLHRDAMEFIESKVEDGHSSVLVGLTLLSMGSVLLSRSLGHKDAADVVDILRKRLGTGDADGLLH